MACLRGRPLAALILSPVYLFPPLLDNPDLLLVTQRETANPSAFFLFPLLSHRHYSFKDDVKIFLFTPRPLEGVFPFPLVPEFPAFKLSLSCLFLLPIFPLFPVYTRWRALHFLNLTGVFPPIKVSHSLGDASANALFLYVSPLSLLPSIPLCVAIFATQAF